MRRSAWLYFHVIDAFFVDFLILRRGPPWFVAVEIKSERVICAGTLIVLGRSILFLASLYFSLTVRFLCSWS